MQTGNGWRPWMGVAMLLVAMASGPGRLELLPMGENPHARGMLVERLPGAGGALFVSDLATPAPLERYPAGSHAALDRFLARWLESAGSPRTPCGPCTEAER